MSLISPQTAIHQSPFPLPESHHLDCCASHPQKEAGWLVQYEIKPQPEQNQLNPIQSNNQRRQAHSMQPTSSRVSPPSRRHPSARHAPPPPGVRLKTDPQKGCSGEDPVQQECQIKLSSSHLGDRPSRNKIVIRKSKNSFALGMKTAYSHFRNDSNPPALRPHPFQSVQFSHRRTQKERFIEQLQNNVLNSRNPSQVRCKTTDDHRVRQVESHRYNPIANDITARSRISPNKSSESVGVAERKEEGGLLRIKSLQEGEGVSSPFRSRSRTIAKEFIIQGMQEMMEREKSNEISKTIEINPLEIREKIRQSLNEIEKFEKRSISPETQEIGLESYRGRHSGVNVVPRRPTQADDASDFNSTLIKNTEIYEEEVDHLTKEFLGEWARMNLSKNQIYQSLRNKLMKEYPNMRKHYAHCSVPHHQAHQAHQTQQTPQKAPKVDNEDFLFTNELPQSQLRLSQNLRSSNQSYSGALSLTQIKEYQQKLQFFNQKRMLREIFKQAYFYSRTRNKFMSTNYVSSEEKEEEVELRNIQKNLTFMGYMRDKCGKSVLNRNRKIRGINIIRNKDSILELEPEGTRGQLFLKKCLDDAIEDCIRANQ